MSRKMVALYLPGGGNPMSEFLGAVYPWLKAVHIISVISWMAGMLYLPRLFVYHCTAEPGSALSETLKVMESRLQRVIMTPAMAVTWLFGLLLLASPMIDISEHWLQVKLVLVIAMSVIHETMARWRRDFAADVNQRSQRFYRIANEVPTLLMIGIVILVITKPF
jgi:putative membrane protein